MVQKWPNDPSSHKRTGPSHKAPARLGSSTSRSWVPQENGARKGENSCLTSTQLRSSGSWRRPGAASSAEQQRLEVHRSVRRHAAVVENTDDEWASKTEWHRVCVFRPRLAEYVATTIKKGSHVLVEGSLVSTTYERGNGKGKKARTNKQTFWCISRRCRRQAGSGASGHAAEPSDASPF